MTNVYFLQQKKFDSKKIVSKCVMYDAAIIIAPVEGIHSVLCGRA